MFVIYTIEASWEEQNGPPKPVLKWLRAEGRRLARGFIVVRRSARTRAPALGKKGLAWLESPKGGSTWTFLSACPHAGREREREG